MADGSVPQSEDLLGVQPLDPYVDPARFYVYFLWRPDGRPMYVGKGNASRWRVHFRRSHNEALKAAIRKYGAEVSASRVFVDNESEAYELESLLVSEIGRKPHGPLLNQSDGGRGGSTGRKQSAEERRRRSDSACRRMAKDLGVSS